MTPRFTPSESRSRSRNSSTDGGLVRKEFPVAECAVDEEARTVKFTITTNDVDRDNDVVSSDGWDISDFMKSPVVLWAHDHKQPPIAQATAVRRTANGMTSTAKFPKKGIYPFADMIFELIKGGFIRACSVGFRPLEYVHDAARGGINFLRQSLLEWSVVPVPANQNALVAAAAKGVDVSLLREWAAKALRDADAENVIDITDDEGLEVTDDLAALGRAARSKSADDTIDIDPDDLRQALREVLPGVVGHQVRELARHMTAAAIAQARGRVLDTADALLLDADIRRVRRAEAGADLRTTIFEAVDRGIRLARGRLD